MKKEILYHKYHIENKKTSVIAAELGCTKYAILYWLKKHNIPIKSSNKIGYNLTNKKYYNITYIRDSLKRAEDGQVIWDCECDCGKKIELTTSYFKKQKSCGCLMKLKNAQCTKWQGYEEISGSLWSKIKNQAIKRGLVFDITIEYIWELFLKQDRRCALSGIPISIQYQSRNITASLDRIDSNKGYIEGNVQWVYIKVNYMKQNYDEKTFLELCRTIVNYQFGEKNEKANDTPAN